MNPEPTDRTDPTMARMLTRLLPHEALVELTESYRDALEVANGVGDWCAAERDALRARVTELETALARVTSEADESNRSMVATAEALERMRDRVVRAEALAMEARSHGHVGVSVSRILRVLGGGPLPDPGLCARCGEPMSEHTPMAWCDAAGAGAIGPAGPEVSP